MTINHTEEAKHSTPIQIRFNDIDIMAHVNNSVYQNYFDTARMKYFEDVFLQNMDWKIQALILAKITIDYINPIFLNENIVVLSTIHKIGNKSLQMNQVIINSDTKELKATNNAILVSFAVKENKSIPIPDDWRKKITEFEKPGEL